MKAVQSNLASQWQQDITTPEELACLRTFSSLQNSSGLHQLPSSIPASYVLQQLLDSAARVSRSSAFLNRRAGSSLRSW